jgi:CSLREA domain-containing protein
VAKHINRGLRWLMTGLVMWIALSITIQANGTARAAALFVVNSVNDPGDGTCDATECTLHEAVAAANLAPGTDTIRFAIPGAGVHTINPDMPIPLITDPLIIDGTTQPGYAGTPLIELDGTGVIAPQVEYKVGINIISGGSTVRGLAINRFDYGGVGILSGNGNVIESNVIGTNPAGTMALPNLYGVIIYQSSNNTIGGTTAAKGNLISGNSNDGVNIGGSGSTNNIVQGNTIGTNMAGTAALGNHDKGVKVEDSFNTTITGNLIADSGLYGVFLKDTSGNIVRNNMIGMNSVGTPLGNHSHGVFIQGGSNNTVGGTGAGQGNVIAFNGGMGVDVEPFSPSAGVINDAFNNSILSNSIYNNADLGIDLNTDYITYNDAADADEGPNHQQNFPIIASVFTNTTGNIQLSGSLNSVADQTYRVEFFINDTCDASVYGEGKAFLGFTSLNTDSSGDAFFNNFNFAAVVPLGKFITATATDSSGNTSEFSDCKSTGTLTPINATPVRNIITALSLPAQVPLTWSRITWATGYQVQVATDTTFTNAALVADDAALPAGKQFTSVSVPGYRTYYWRVRAKQANGIWSPTWSVVETFTVVSP